MRFEKHIGIDYSGAATPQSRSATIQVYSTDKHGLPESVAAPASVTRKRNWNRAELAGWLTETLNTDQRVIVGMDHGFSFPLSYFQRYDLRSWDAFLEDFANHWPTHRKNATVESFRASTARAGDNSEFRVTERWTSSAKSVFQFDVNGSVAKSTHAGLPFLFDLRRIVKQRVHFWPFDGWDVPDHKSVIAEIYPSLFRNRYPREQRSGDQQDAYAVSRFLSEMDGMQSLDRFFSPPLTPAQKRMAKLEGWILGVL